MRKFRFFYVTRSSRIMRHILEICKKTNLLSFEKSSTARSFGALHVVRATVLPLLIWTCKSVWKCESVKVEVCKCGSESVEACCPSHGSTSAHLNLQILYLYLYVFNAYMFVYIYICIFVFIFIFNAYMLSKPLFYLCSCEPADGSNIDWRFRFVSVFSSKLDMISIHWFCGKFWSNQPFWA